MKVLRLDVLAALLCILAIASGVNADGDTDEGPDDVDKPDEPVDSEEPNKPEEYDDQHYKKRRSPQGPSWPPPGWPPIMLPPFGFRSDKSSEEATEEATSSSEESSGRSDQFYPPQFPLPPAVPHLHGNNMENLGSPMLSHPPSPSFSFIYPPDSSANEFPNPAQDEHHPFDKLPLPINGQNRKICTICDGSILCGDTEYFPECTVESGCTEKEYKICKALIEENENSTNCDRYGTFPDPTSKWKYISCKVDTEQYHLGFIESRGTCPLGTKFNPPTRRCLTHSDSEIVKEVLNYMELEHKKTMTCRTPGLYPYPGDCKLYFKCGNCTKPLLFSCPKNEYFDGHQCSSGRSVDCTMSLITTHLAEVEKFDTIYYWAMMRKSETRSVNTDTATPKCPYVDYAAAFPRNCNKYYVCKRNVMTGKLVPIVLNCEPGEYYSNEERGCVTTKPPGC